MLITHTPGQSQTMWFSDWGDCRICKSILIFISKCFIPKQYFISYMWVKENKKVQIWLHSIMSYGSPINLPILNKYWPNNPKRSFLPIFQLPFWISLVQASDAVKFCVVKSRSIILVILILFLFFIFYLFLS